MKDVSESISEGGEDEIEEIEDSDDEFSTPGKDQMQAISRKMAKEFKASKKIRNTQDEPVEKYSNRWMFGGEALRLNLAPKLNQASA